MNEDEPSRREPPSAALREVTRQTGLPWDCDRGDVPITVQYHRLTTARAWRRASDITAHVRDCDGLFVSPPWNMMLEAYISRCEHRRLSTKKIATASGAPFTSALRYLNALADKGLLASTPDPHDARRRFVMITEHGNDLMNDALDKAVASDHALGLTRLQVTK